MISNKIVMRVECRLTRQYVFCRVQFFEKNLLQLYSSKKREKAFNDVGIMHAVKKLGTLIPKQMRETHYYLPLLKRILPGDFC